MSKKAKVLRKKKKNFHVRFIISALAFLLGTIAIIVALLIFMLYESARVYFVIPVIVLFVLDFVCGIFIANSSVQVDFKVSWLTILLCLPFAGAILYLLFAQKITTKSKKKRRYNVINRLLITGQTDSRQQLSSLKSIDPDSYNIAKKLERWSFASLYQNTNVEYFNYGQYGFPKMIEELKKAKRFIFFEYFIIESGEFFDSIYEVLKEKAKEGVDVRMIYDDFGSVTKMDTYFFKEVRKNGIRCFPFNRIRPTVDIRQNSRDHRKILVIDGIVGFTGGCNIADEYINKVRRFGVWRDNIIMLKGEAVSGLSNIFLSNWMLYEGRKFDDEPKNYQFEKNKDLVNFNITNDGYVQPFGEVPFDGENGARDAFLTIIQKAQKYVYISTPYLIPDSEIMTALETAAKSGVDVRIVTPGIPDKKMVYSVTRSYYAPLLIAGVKIYEYLPGFNHAKIIVSDDKRAITGTANLDFRSFYLHFENCVFLADNSKINDIKIDLINMCDEGLSISSSDYLNINLFKKIKRAFLRIIAPLL